MDKRSKYIPRIAYLRKPQEDSLKDIKETILVEYGVSIPITEFVRDSIDNFIENEGKNLQSYVTSKGF